MLFNIGGFFLDDVILFYPLVSLSLHHPIVLLALLSAAGIRNSKRLSSFTVTLLDLLLQFCRAVKSGHPDMIKYHVTSLVVELIWGKIVLYVLNTFWCCHLSLIWIITSKLISCIAALSRTSSVLVYVMITNRCLMSKCSEGGEMSLLKL